MDIDQFVVFLLDVLEFCVEAETVGLELEEEEGVFSVLPVLLDVCVYLNLGVH